MKKIRSKIALAIVLCLGISLASKSQYCVPRTANATCNFVITKVNVGDYSFNPSFDCLANGGYFYFSTDTLFAQTGSMTTVASTNSGTAVNPRMQMFVDFNKNNLFDLSENFQLTRDGAAQTHSGQISMSTTPGTYRLRVMYLTDFSSDGCGPTTGTMYNTVDYVLQVSDSLPVPPNNPTAYCSANGPCAAVTGTNNYAITNVTIMGDNATSINNTTTCDNYGDYTSNIVRLGDTTVYNMTVKATVNQFYSISGVYIDWNDDKIFSANEETITNNNRIDGYDITLLMPIQAPATGYKRMRIRNTLLLNTPTPCGTQADGEVEDYTILYVNPNDTIPSCIATALPQNMATGVCQNLTLRWNKVKDAKNYKLYLKNKTNNTVVVDNQTVVDTFFIVPILLDVASEYQWIATPFGTAFAIDCDSLTFTTAAQADPMAVVLPANDTIQVCLYNNFQLDGNPSLGTSPYTHSWNGSSNINLNDLTISNPIFTANIEGNFAYRYQVVDNNGCSASDSVFLKVVPLPTSGVLSSNVSELCSGSKALLNYSTYTGTLLWQDSIAGGNWSNTTLLDLGDNKYETAALNQTLYYRAVVSLGQCTDTSNIVMLTVNALPNQPIITANPGVSVCVGQSITLTASAIGTITWNDALNTQGNTITITSGTNYTAQLTDNKGCKSESSQVVNFSALPAKPIITVTGNNPACQGENITLTSNATVGNAWSTGAVNQSITANQSGSYGLTVSDGTCSNSADPVSLLFNDKPTTPIVSANKSMACDGEEILLSVSNANGTISWNDVENTQGATLLVKESGSYTATAVNGFNCSSSSAPFIAVFEALPTQPVIILSNGILSVNSLPNHSYQWYNTEGKIDGATNFTFAPSRTGQYYCIETSANNCSSTPSDEFSYIDNGLDKLIQSSFIIYPNPSKDWFTISLTEATQKADLKIIDITGQVVLTTKVSSSSTKIKHNLPAGFYLLQLKTSTDYQTTKIVIE